MTTSGNWPARFGEFDWLAPCAPWHIVQFSASVPPRPTASLLPARPIAGSSTTLVDIGVAFAAAPVDHDAGTPAARQIAAHNPCAVKSWCIDGSTTKPTSIDTSAIAISEPTLQRNQGLAQ